MGWKIDVEHAMSDFERMLEESEWEEFWAREREKEEKMKQKEEQNGVTKPCCRDTFTGFND